MILGRESYVKGGKIGITLCRIQDSAFAKNTNSAFWIWCSDPDPQNMYFRQFGTFLKIKEILFENQELYFHRN